MAFNLVDIALFLVLALSICFSHAAHFIKEFIKLLGTLLATFVSLHYYIPVGAFLKNKHIFPEPLPELMAFIVLATVVIYSFVLIGDGWLLILKLNFPKWLEKWGNLVVTVVRTMLVFGLIFVALLISGGAAAKQAKQSVSRVLVGYISLQVYQGFFNGIVTKILPQEPINQVIIDAVMSNGEESLEHRSSVPSQAEN